MAEATRPGSLEGPVSSERPNERHGLNIRRDVAITTAAQVGVVIGGLLLYRLIAIHKGPSGVAAYTLVKQVVVFLFPVTILGMQIGVPRYVALCRDEHDRPERFLLAAMVCATAASAAACLLLLAWPSGAASLLFGSSHRTTLLAPLAATLLATVAVEVAAGYFRGLFDFKTSAVLRVVGVAAVPVVLLVVLPQKSIATLILLMALALLALSMLAVALPLARAFIATSRAALAGAAGTLLNYGTRRVPGDLASVALWTVTPVVASHFVSLRQVAYLGAGIQVLMVVSTAFQPIGLIFLPIMTRLWAVDRERARWYAGQLSAAAIHIALFATPQILLFGDVAVRAWLGPSFNHAGGIVRLTLFPVAAYICSVVLRSTLDAATVRAYNSRNRLWGLVLAVAIGAVLLGTGVGTRIEAISLAFSSGVLATGVLTFLTTRRLYEVPSSAWASGTALALAAGSAAIGAGVRFLVIGSHASLSVLVLVLVLEAGLATAFVVGLLRAGLSWPAEFQHRLLRRR